MHSHSTQHTPTQHNNSHDRTAVRAVDNRCCSVQTAPLFAPLPSSIPQLPRIILDRKREHVGLDVLLDIHDLCPGLGVQIVYGAFE
jgi:hypothetical protein